MQCRRSGGLRARWHEEANHVHVSRIVPAHTDMHAAIFGFPRGEVLPKGRLAVLRRDNQLRRATTCWHKPDYTFDRRAVQVIAALQWIPIMRVCGRGNSRAAKDRQGDESGSDDLHVDSSIREGATCVCWIGSCLAGLRHETSLKHG
jgi:hypothetical protein